MSRIFLSYAREDVEAAKALAEAMSAAGHEVWWDRHIQGGSRFTNEARASFLAWKGRQSLPAAECALEIDPGLAIAHCINARIGQATAGDRRTRTRLGRSGAGVLSIGGGCGSTESPNRGNFRVDGG